MFTMQTAQSKSSFRSYKNKIKNNSLQTKNKEIKHAWFILGGVWFEVKKIVVNYYRVIIIRAIFKGIKLDFNDV